MNEHPKWHQESDSPVDSIRHHQWKLQKGIDEIVTGLPPWARKAFRLYMKIAPLYFRTWERAWRWLRNRPTTFHDV